MRHHLLVSLPSQRCPGYVVRLHPLRFSHWDVLGIDPILHHGHRP